MIPVTSAMLAAFFGILGAVLTLRVILSRVRLKVVAGDGGNRDMAKVIRAHANFTEQVPLALVLFTLAELCGAPRVPLYLLGALLVLARCLSAWGLSSAAGLSTGRQAGAGMTLAYMVATAGLLVYSVLGR